MCPSFVQKELRKILLEYLQWMQVVNKDDTFQVFQHHHHHHHNFIVFHRHHHHHNSIVFPPPPPPQLYCFPSPPPRPPSPPPPPPFYCFPSSTSSSSILFFFLLLLLNSIVFPPPPPLPQFYCFYVLDMWTTFQIYFKLAKLQNTIMVREYHKETEPKTIFLSMRLYTVVRMSRNFFFNSSLVQIQSTLSASLSTVSSKPP